MARVLLIVFDSLRKDVFDRCEHPLLRRWRARGVSFDRCYSQSGFTPISFSSIITGLFPSACPVRAEAPVYYATGPRERAAAPVWWSVSDHGHLVLPGSAPVLRSVFSVFEHRLLSIAYAKTNAFAELAPEDMVQTPEWGQDFSVLASRFNEIAATDDWLMILRVYDTHLPYGRGISPCDAPSMSLTKARVAALFRENAGRTLLETVAVPALERALDYLGDFWYAVEDQLDFAAIMSDHGDQWSAQPEDVGHATFLEETVLHVPLIVITGSHRGRCAIPCNNLDVLPTLLPVAGKTASWDMPGRSLLPVAQGLSSGFTTEANSSRGIFLRAARPTSGDGHARI